jgi:O-antigen ligase
VAAGLIALASLSPKLAIGALVGLTFLETTRRNLAAGLAMFTFLSFFDQLPGFEALGAIVAKLAGAVLMFFWMLSIIERKRQGPPTISAHPALAGAVLLFCAWVSASALWAAEDPLVAVSTAFRIVQGVILLVVTWTVVQERRHVWWILTGFVAGAFLTAMLGFQQARSGGGRLAGDFGDPNELAAVLVAAIVLAAGALLLRRGWVRYAGIAAIPVMGLAMVQTDSQGGLVSFATALLVASLLAGPARRAVLLGVFGVLSAATFYYTFITPPVSILEVVHGQGGSGREDLWKAALQVAGDHPVIGVGAGNFPLVEPGYAFSNVSLKRVDLVVKPEVAHNTYLHLLAEYGVVGLSLFFAIVGGCLALAFRAFRSFMRTGERELEVLTRFAMVATVAILVAFTFLTAQYKKQLWLLLGLSAALSAIAERIEAETRRRRALRLPPRQHLPPHVIREAGLTPHR